MIDLMITQSGDLMFSPETRKQNRVKLAFFISNTKACKLDFIIKDSSPIQPSPTQIKLSFEIDDKKKTYTSKIVTKKDFAKQFCYFSLKTQLGELKTRKSVGSRIEEIKHKFLYSETTISNAKTIVKEAIKDLFPNAIVTAEPVVIQIKNHYKQVMLLKVYDDDILILEYEMG